MFLSFMAMKACGIVGEAQPIMVDPYWPSNHLPQLIPEWPGGRIKTLIVLSKTYQHCCRSSARIKHTDGRLTGSVSETVPI